MTARAQLSDSAAKECWTAEASRARGSGVIEEEVEEGGQGDDGSFLQTNPSGNT